VNDLKNTFLPLVESTLNICTRSTKIYVIIVEGRVKVMRYQLDPLLTLTLNIGRGQN
jgi:hypothetical protein